MTTISIRCTAMLTFTAISLSITTVDAQENHGPSGSKRRQELIEMALALTSQYHDGRANMEPYASLRSAVDQCKQLYGKDDPEQICEKADTLSQNCQNLRDDWDRRKATVLAEAAAENIQKLIPALPRMELPPCARSDRQYATPSAVAHSTTSSPDVVALPRRETSIGKNYFDETIAKSDRGLPLESHTVTAPDETSSDSKVVDSLLAIAGGFAQAKLEQAGNRSAAQALAQSMVTAEPARQNATAPATRSTAQGTSLTAQSQRRRSGPITEHCVTYRNLKLNDSGMQWFEFKNGCPVDIKVWHTGASGEYTNLSTIPAGRSTSSWFSVSGPHAQQRISYFACRATEMGQEVLYDRKAQECYYMLR